MMRISDEPWWVDVRLLCTDRGTHPSRELGVVSLDDTGELSAVGPGQSSTGHTVRRMDILEDVDCRPRYRPAKCPTCDRDYPLRAENMERLVKGVVAHHKPSPGARVPVDLSYLPS